MSLRTARCTAVGRHHHIQLPHVGVVGGGYDATIRGQSGNHQRRASEFSQQNLQRALVERRVHGFQYKVIVLIRANPFHKFPAPRFGPQAITEEFSCIGAPLSEIIIYIQHGNVRPTGSGLQACNVWGDPQCVLEEVGAIAKLEVINHIYNQHHDV